jgi:hypothetical protein
MVMVSGRERDGLMFVPAGGFSRLVGIKDGYGRHATRHTDPNYTPLGKEGKRGRKK